MTCPNCKRETVALFLTVACDWCDYLPCVSKLHSGYIVHNPAYRDAYVFMFAADAKLFSADCGDLLPVRKVYSLTAFRWFLSNGIVPGAKIAMDRYDVFHDHRYEPLPNRVFLAPEGV